jgi:hypothetical protein
MNVQNAGEKIRVAVTSWPGVTAREHSFGGVEFRYGNREIGHIHGDTLVDIRLPRELRDELVLAQEARPHHWSINPNWVSFYIIREDDLKWAIVLMRRSLESIIELHEWPQAAA